MELEFDREHWKEFDTILDTTICQEETLESIVPDACPDIGRIAESWGQAFLTNRQTVEDRAVISGVIRAVILYEPEDDKTIHCLELSLPFTCQQETPGLTSDGSVHAFPALRSVEARALNPRKVLLRVNLGIRMTVCQPREIEVCTAVNASPEVGLCELIRETELFQLSGVEARPFMFSEELKPNCSSGSRILFCRGCAAVDEQKLVGSRLIFKGKVNLQLLIQEESGSLCSHQESLPFSQVMELPGLGQRNESELCIALTDLSFRPAEEDGHSIEVTIELLAQARVWSFRTVPVLQDLYSTVWETQATTELLPSPQLLEHGERTQSIRELLETGTEVHAVLDSWIFPGEITQKREGDQLVVTSDCIVTVLTLDEEGRLQALHRSLPVSSRIDCPADSLCRCRCSHNGEVYPTLTAGGVEVRFHLDFQDMVTTENQIPVIKSGMIADGQRRGGEEQPSLVLRLASAGETLWDLAKAYGTTIDQITAANALEGEQPPCDSMLLIPSAR